MDYIGMNAPNGIIQIVLRRQRVVDTRRCGSVIILSVNAENQRLGKFNQINQKFNILSSGENLKDVLLSFLPNVNPDDVVLLRSPDPDKYTFFVYHPTDEMSDGKKVYELCELKSDDKSFERWFISNYRKNIDANESRKEIIEKLNYALREAGHELVLCDFVCRNASNLRIEKMRAFTRVGYFDGKDGEVIYMSLHDWLQTMVEITCDGVRNLREKNAPVWFMKNESMRSIATPKYELDEEDHINVQKTISHLNDLQKYVNVNKEDFCLIIAWLLIALKANPIIDAPILWLEGKRSSGKSTSTKFLKRLIDPDMFSMLQQSVSARNFSAALAHRYILAIDNVSSVTPRLNDMLCGAVTDQKNRVVQDDCRYYLNRYYFICNISRHNNIIVNSLDTVSKSSELQERCFTVKTCDLNKDNRMANEELEALFREEAPYILGALLVALSFGLKNRDYKPQLDVETRLLDACQFVARVAHSASESGLPFTEDDFIKALRGQRAGLDAVNETRIEDNVVAQTIYDMAREKVAQTPKKDEIEVWNDSTKELLKEFRKRLVNDHNSFNELPRNTQKLGKILSEISSLLSEVGIKVDRTSRESTRRLTRITYTPPSTSECNEPLAREVNGASETKNNIE